jgi:transposase
METCPQEGWKRESYLAILSHHEDQSEGWSKEVAVGTIIHGKQQGNTDRHQRWERLERADLCAQYSALQVQGLSQRQAARGLEVPRSTLQAWRTYHERLDACPAVVAFCHSVPGLAFLHRLVLGIHLVCPEVGACGIRLVCLLLKLTGLDRFVAASYGVQHRVNGQVEEAIVAYRREESARLAKAMPAQDITLAKDATCTGGLCLVAMDPKSNDLLLEQAAPARDQDAWQKRMEQALVGLTCRVIQSTSDEAPGLLAYVEQHLGAHHSPDLFHRQYELSKAVSAPMAVKPRAASQAVAQAEETLKRVHERLDTTDGEPAKRGPGRPPKVAASLEQVAQDVEVARHEHQRLTKQREQVAQSIRTIGHADPFVDVERGVRRNGKLSAGDIHAQIDTIRTVAQQEHRSETCLERMAKAARVVPKMQATIACVSSYVRQPVRHLNLPPPPSYALHAHLMPACYLERVASTRTRTAGEPLRALAERLRTPLFEPDGALCA